MAFICDPVSASEFTTPRSSSSSRLSHPRDDPSMASSTTTLPSCVKQQRSEAAGARQPRKTYSKRDSQPSSQSCVKRKRMILSELPSKALPEQSPCHFSAPRPRKRIEDFFRPRIPSSELSSSSTSSPLTSSPKIARLTLTPPSSPPSIHFSSTFTSRSVEHMAGDSKLGTKRKRAFGDSDHEGSSINHSGDDCIGQASFDVSFDANEHVEDSSEATPKLNSDKLKSKRRASTRPILTGSDILTNKALSDIGNDDSRESRAEQEPISQPVLAARNGYASNEAVTFPTATSSTFQRLAQQTLDLGQPTIIKCDRCSFTYNTTLAEERREHDRYHEQYLNGPNYNSISAALRAKVPKFGYNIDEDGKESFTIIIDRHMKQPLKDFAEDALSFIDGHVMCQTIESHFLWSTVSEEVAKHTVAKTQPKIARLRNSDTENYKEAVDQAMHQSRFKVYLRIGKTGQLLGCLLAEQIFMGREYLWTVIEWVAGDYGKRINVGNQHGVMDYQEEERHANPNHRHHPAYLGVNKIWVARDHRRKGIARSLVDLARTTIISGCNIEKHEVAWTQCLSAGEQLAKSYIKEGREDSDEWYDQREFVYLIYNDYDVVELDRFKHRGRWYIRGKKQQPQIPRQKALQWPAKGTTST